MCVVSMVMDHWGNEWTRKYWPSSIPWEPNTAPGILPSLPSMPYNSGINFPTQAEIDEFRRLLDRAREYDKRNNEPDCENDGKKQLLKQMAKELGVDINFIDNQYDD